MDKTDMRILTLAIPYYYGSDGAQVVRLAEDVCRSNDLTGTPAGLGPHTTILPPFYCKEGEMRGLCYLAHMLWQLYHREQKVEIQGFEVFEPSTSADDIGAIYLALDVGKEFRSVVERFKQSWPYGYVHPPASRNAVDRVWIPHISVVEGRGLHKKAKPLLPALSEYVRGRTVSIGEAKFFEKRRTGIRDHRWEQILV